MICRRGHLTKQDIGAIRVFQRETRFQIKATVADRFLEAAGAPDQDGVIIERADGPAPDLADNQRGPRERPPRRPRPEREPRNEGGEDAPFEKKPYGKKDFGPRPDRDGEAGGKPKRPFDRPRGPKPGAPHDPLAAEQSPPKKAYKLRHEDRAPREGGEGQPEFKQGWAKKKPFKAGGSSKFAGPPKSGGGGAKKGKGNDGGGWAKKPFKGKPARD
jgi:ATP-dependent RNA helicase DeaD